MSGKGLYRSSRCLNCAFKSLAPVQRRTFTSSPAHQRHGAVPSFTPASSPELDELLSSLRNKVFLPSHLSKSHRDLIYKEKHQRTLEVEPVFATIAGEKFHLEHIDLTKDVPGKRSALRSAVDLMTDKKDWDNLPSLLIGFKDAKRILSAEELCWLARKAGMAGRHDIILQCARRVSDTGFELKNIYVVAEIMWQLQHKAMKSKWAAKETSQAFSWAEMISELLEDERHAGGKVVDLENDPRTQPEVIGILLQLSAVWAKRFYSGEDRDGKVAQYAARLLELHDVTNKDRGQLHRGPEFFHFANRYVTYMVPVWHGVELAELILGQVVKEHLKENSKEEGLKELGASLWDVIAGFRMELHGEVYPKSRSGHEVRGRTMWDQLVDDKEGVSLLPKRKIFEINDRAEQVE